MQAAEDAWNARDPAKVALAYTPNSVWRNRDTFVIGREQIIEFLTRKSKKEQGYAPPQRALGFPRQPYGRPVQYEWHDTSGQWSRSYGNKLWEFTPEGLMSRREASINDHAITADEPASTDPVPKPSTGSTSYLVTTMTTRDSGEERLAACAALATQDPVLAAMTQTHGTPDPFV